MAIETTKALIAVLQEQVKTLRDNLVGHKEEMDRLEENIDSLSESIDNMEKILAQYHGMAIVIMGALGAAGSFITFIFSHWEKWKNIL